MDASPLPLPSQAKSPPGLAVASMVFGLLSLMAIPFSAVLGLPVIICGQRARRRIARSNGELTGKGLALTGLISGCLSLVLATVSVLLLVYDRAVLANAAMTAAMPARATANTLKTSLMAYTINAGQCPSTEQGLQALVTRPTIEPRPSNWKKILDQVPLDPWGREFIYLHPGLRNPKGFDLFSPGEDGVPNTKDDVWP